MKTSIPSVHPNFFSLDNITMVMVGIFVLGVISGLIVFMVYQHKNKKNSKINVIILLIASLALTSTVSATEWSVFKNGKYVFIFQIENYRDKNMYVMTNALIEPKTSDLVTLGLPKEAWSTVNRIGNGVFDTRFDIRIDKLQAKVSALQKENAKLNTNLIREQNAKLLLFVTAAILIILLLIFIYQDDKVRKKRLLKIAAKLDTINNKLVKP